MTTTRITVLEKELDIFKESCNGLDHIEYVSYDKDKITATVKYKYDFTLFHLGYILNINKQINELKEV